MATYYLDIETTGLDPKINKIITIQYQEVDRYTGKAKGELIILKEWESSEKEIIEKFIADTKILENYAFSFVALGFNLTFEHNFLKERSKINNLKELDILNCPFIDLRAITILMNDGQFKGSSLDAMTGKKNNGSRIPEYYKAKNYVAIIDYIKDETIEFLRFNAWLYKNMPKLHADFVYELFNGEED